MKKILQSIKYKNLIFLLIAGCINAIGVTLFLAPVKLYDSGISGTSILLSQITPENWNISIFLILLNLPLFLVGLKKQGTLFTIYSLFTIFIYAIVAWLITDVLPIDVRFASPLAGQDLLLCAIFGGVISGIGSGMTIRNGGAIDGIEVMAVVFSKKLNITIGSFVMIYNVLLYIICGIIKQSWILPLYSIVTYAVGLKTIDFVVEGIDRSKSVMIVTDKAKEINLALLEEFKCGTTIIPAIGGYSNEKKEVILFIVNKFQIYKIRNIIHNVDPKAFVTITEVTDVFKNNE